MYLVYAKEGRKFYMELNEGLRPRVINNRPETLSEAIEMATNLDEDYARS